MSVIMRNPEKRPKWGWTEEQNIDFKHLKKEITAQPRLPHYNSNKENIVTIDVCKAGLERALLQKQTNGDLKPIAFARRYRNDAEKILGRRVRTTSRSLGPWTL